MIKYRVLLNGTWTDVDYGIQISRDRLAYWVGSYRGIAKRNEFRLHPDTVADLKFKNACKLAMANSEPIDSKPKKYSKHVAAC